MGREKPKTFIYLRCSTTKQSTDTHFPEIESYIKYKALDALPIMVVDDPAVSGTKSWKTRKIYDIVTKAPAKSNLVVSELSRLGRKQIEILEILQLCSDRKIKVHSIKENFVDDDSINSCAMRGIFSTMAQVERKLTSERSKSAAETCRLKGIKVGTKLEDHPLDPYADEIREQIEKGATLRDMAGKYGLTYRKMYTFARSRKMIQVKDIGVRNHSKDVDDRMVYLPSSVDDEGNPVKYKKYKLDKYIDQLNEELVQGKSYSDISKKFGWTIPTISNYVKLRSQ